jgi:hypothetical protein
MFDAAGLALQPPQGGFPCGLSAFGSARRLAPFSGCVTYSHQSKEKKR